MLVGLFLNAVAQKWGKGPTRVPDLRLKFALPSGHPNGATFTVPKEPDEPEGANATDYMADIFVLNTSSYDARNPALNIEFRGAGIRADIYAGSRGWTPTARDPATGDIIALQWDGGPNYQIRGNSSFGLPVLNLQGLSQFGTGRPEMAIRLLADGYSRAEIVLAVEFLTEPSLVSTENVPPEWL